MPHVFFDLDGTLTDSAPGIVRCIQHALRELGSTPPPHEQIVPCIGTRLEQIFRELLETEESGLLERAIALYLERFAREGIGENRLYPGALEALSVLRDQRHGLRLATAKRPEAARAVISHFALDSFFEGVHGMDPESGADKAALLREVVDRDALDPTRCVMVGDRHHDVAAARACGIRAVAVTWGYATPGELAAAGPDATVHSFEELVELLRAR